jgi:hypothetical protein
MIKRRVGRKNPEVIGIHVGTLLTKKLKEYHITKAEVARRISRPHSSLYTLTHNPSMQAYLLWELSIAMNFDFFATLSSELQQKHPEIKSEHAAIIALQKELSEMKQERDNLKKVVELLGK